MVTLQSSSKAMGSPVSCAPFVTAIQVLLGGHGGAGTNYRTTREFTFRWRKS